MTLARRVFLWMVAPMGALLVAGFVAAGYTVEDRVKDQLRRAQRESEQRLRRVREGYQERNRRLLGVLAENPSLKAGLGLLHSGLPPAEVRRTIEDQLRELAGTLDLSLIAIADPAGAPIAGLVRSGSGWRTVDRTVIAGRTSGLIEFDGRVFTLSTVPVNLADENLGRLAVATDFRLDDFPGRTLLLRGDALVQSNLPPGQAEAVAQALAACPGGDECRLTLAGETYLSLALDDSSFEGGYRMRVLESLDAARTPWKHSLRAVFGVTGFLALLAAVAVAGFASRAVTAPLSALIDELRISERLATLPSGFAASATSARSTAMEVRELAAAFNRAAAAVSDSRARLEEAHLEFIMAMAHALDARDVYTAGHSRRVSEYSCAIARQLGLPGKTIDLIRVGALLHDIGKLGVPDAILRKPGRLTEEETLLVQRHPVTGVEILAEVRGFERYIPIVELHHENPDGSGYPHGLRAHQIPREVAIVHVADAYDAMTSDRPYRLGLSHEIAAGVLRRNVDTQFDAEIVDAFLRLPPPRRDPTPAADGAGTGLSQLSLAVDVHSTGRLPAAPAKPSHEMRS
ncbi:MAG: HD domain-containing protein [Bryobacteraceae bacterium]